MENRTVLDATTEIVVAAVSQRTGGINTQSAKELAEFAEIIYEKFYDLQNKPR